MDHVEFFPAQASTIAGSIDNIYFVWLALSAVIALAIAVLLVIFSIKYRHGSRADRRVASPERYEHTMHRIEVTWTVVPLIIFLAMFLWSAHAFYESATVPNDAVPVYVVGKQWMWHIEHQGGQREIGELHIPVGRTIELVMTSQDVIHSFSVPGFRVKQDVLPGRYTTLWFKATRTGDFRWFCTQYCGAAHSRMIGRVLVMEPSDFDRWLALSDTAGSMAAKGAARFRQFGCSGCHGPSANVHAPRLEGLFGKPVQLQDGRTVIADERFLRDSVFMPNKEVPANYEAIMPSFRGQIDEEQMLEIIEYLKSTESIPQGVPR
jgi:cytochrome c oxidase subunit 2